MSVKYLMSGAAHVPYLVVSLYSLREHYSGPVTIYSWPETVSYINRLREDKRLGIRWRPWYPTYRGKNAQFLAKQYVMQASEETSLYLDADTLICASPLPLLRKAEDVGFVATQFNDWTTRQRIVIQRIRRLEQFRRIDDELIERTLGNTYPSVNGGVFACHPNSRVLPLWQSWTKEARSIFIADETVLHILQPKFFDTHEMYTSCHHGKWNSSPKYRSPHLHDDGVCIWHFHGDSNVRPNKSEKGVGLWYPWFEKCLSENIGGMRDWLPSVSNRHLRELLNERDGHTSGV